MRICGVLFLVGVLALAPVLWSQEGRPQGPEWLQSQQEQIWFASTDAVKLGKEQAYYTRYLDLGNVPAADRPEIVQVLSGHINQLSREPDLTPPRVLGGTYGSLLAVNIQDYGWSFQLWEALANQDPYYHVQAFDHTTKQRQILLAPWLTPTEQSKRDLTTLVAYTRSQVPVVNALWFLNQTGAAVDRAPNYYDFLSGKLGGIKKEKDFQAIIGHDRRLVGLFGGAIRAAVADSGVGEQPRGIGRVPTVGGGYWYTMDFKKALGRQNPLKNASADIEEVYDATEQYGHLPNGLWAMGLFNDKEDVQDSAPDFVGKDSVSTSNDGRIHICVSCVRCHGAGGLRGIDDWIRGLINDPLTANVLAPKGHQNVREFRRAYARNLEQYLARDKAIYEAAVKIATGGMDGKVFAEKLDRWWSWFENGRVDLQRGARDMGVDPAKLHRALAIAVRGGTGDEVLSTWVRKDPKTVPIRQWLEALPNAHEIYRRAYP